MMIPKVFALVIFTLLSITQLPSSRAVAAKEITEDDLQVWKTENIEDDQGSISDITFANLNSDTLPQFCHYYCASLPKRNFNPWGGKRSLLEFPSSDFAGKRGTGTSFNPWGGKRQFLANAESSNNNNRLVKNESPIRSRSSFNPWGGKR